MYRYYCIRTKDTEITWSTDMIQRCIEETGQFTETGPGMYLGNGFFCSLCLMKVKQWDSWSNLDYHSQETNDIDIVTVEDANGCIPKQAEDVMKRLSALLSEPIRSEE